MIIFNRIYRILFVLCFFLYGCAAQSVYSQQKIQTGADQTQLYFPMLKGKKVGVVANATSIIDGKHIVDSMINSGINVSVVFAPEHGFRGEGEAGELISNEVDKKTGTPLVSLYGSHKKPTKSDLQNLDLVLFDIQDVGVRFYTYISTLQYVMEACADNNIPVIVLDRPNPHGHYIDGPVLDTAFSSFVGMKPVPIVYGMTIGEYAKMLLGEGWLNTTSNLKLSVIPLDNYTHKSAYNLPVPPSPNLPNMTSIYLYPSLCLFEGTNVSLGRGTDKPFQIFGYPGMKEGQYVFTPRAIPGKAKTPPFLNEECKGFDLSEFGNVFKNSEGKIYYNWLIQTYQSYPDKSKFFTDFFEKLIGNRTIRSLIKNGSTEDEIRNSYANEINKFKIIRKKYLLYRDFEN